MAVYVVMSSDSSQNTTLAMSSDSSQNTMLAIAAAAKSLNKTAGGYM